MLHTVFLTLGILAAIGVIILAMRARFWPTIVLLVVTVAIMAVMRSFVRAAYVGRFFTVENLQVQPQMDVMIVFFVILAIGLGAVVFMIKLARAAHNRRAAQ